MANVKSFPVIGTGVWGVVHDMGDGTVLKRAREVGGIGSGAEKMAHEVAMMEALAPFAAQLSFAIPQVIDFMMRADDPEGLTLWMRAVKMPGRVYQTSDFVVLSEECRAAMIDSAVRALAEFHKLLDFSGVEAFLQQNFLWNEMEKMGAEKADMERLGNVRAMFRDDARIRAVHGDFNITNILFDEKNCVSGVIDFAEMGLASVEEELSALTTEFPESRARIVSLYEEAAGVAIDATQLKGAEAKSELLSLFIARYRKKDEEAAWVAEVRLAAVMGG
jgi:aminoglycoside phosphotransferase (APT) family kinase protein